MDVLINADYWCWPTWEGVLGDSDDVDPRSLGLSEDLAGALEAWAKDYDATFNQDDPKASGFSTDAAEDLWYGTGLELARKVAAELPDAHVTYYVSHREQLTEVSA